jgi:predicted patatin/cPLA2 family phospholipase
MIIGYTPKDILEFLCVFDLKKTFSFIEKRDYLDNIITEFGLDTGERFMFVVKRLITNKGFNENITLNELYLLTKKKITYSITCLDKYEAVYMNYETHPNVKFIDAIRMTISFPLLFTPFKMDGKLYIDGGVRDNFPIQLVDNEIEESIGITLMSKNIDEDINEIDIKDYIYEIFNCAIYGNIYDKIKKYKKYTIIINNNGNYHNVVNINYLNSDTNKELFNKGIDFAINYFKNNEQEVKNE